MHWTARNVNDAFRTIVTEFAEFALDTEEGQPTTSLGDACYFSRKPSRNGDVIKVVGPCMITYERPWERVLFNQARDCNPFFHVYESLWMLAGRRDLAPLQYYVSTFGDYSDDGQILHGAYGYRWRHWFGYDQLERIIRQLKADPADRRIILQMWDANIRGRVGNLSAAGSGESCDTSMAVQRGKDVPCNVIATFDVDQINGINHLNMTVFNRSNDLVWGTLGANVVHFSFLLEYMAAAVGMDVGQYHQISNNQHMYTDPKRFQADAWLMDTTPDFYVTPEDRPEVTTTVSLVSQNKTVFDLECAEFVERHQRDTDVAGEYTEQFLRDVAQPMCMAYHHHKRRQYAFALGQVEKILADDWRIACRQWIIKRMEKHMQKEEQVG